MIRKILFHFQDRTQLIIAIIGAFLGFTFLITSIHYLIRVNEFGTGAEILGSNTIIVQKKVTNYSSMKLAKTDFSENEIENLQGLPFIEQVEPIKSNSFGVSLQTDSELVPYFRSDVFVQSIDPTFLKVDTTNWKWSPRDEFVPIILPRDFLVMLNTFASAKGIPQVSDEIAQSIGFKFTLYNDKKKEWEKAKIVGFTTEVSSILVPHTFMDYGNKFFPTETPSKITQLMVGVKEGRFGEFEKIMEKRGLESKESSMIVGKLKSIAGTLFSIVMAISIITVFLAGLVLIQYAQLILSKNAYEITTLLRIGYEPKAIIKVVMNYFMRVFAVITLLSVATFTGIKYIIDSLLAKGGIDISSNFTFLSFGAVVLAFIIYTAVNYMSTKKEIVG